MSSYSSSSLSIEISEPLSAPMIKEQMIKEQMIKEEIINANVAKYLDQLSPLQQKAIKIAKMHLGTSFNILKSNGYIDWNKSMD
jgi:hypothetical protein